MKKLILLIGILISFNSFSQIDDISNGESGLSVLNKLNNVFDYVNDSIVTVNDSTIIFVTPSQLEQDKYNEIPSGTINDSNTEFSIVNTPIEGTVRVYINGLRQMPTDDYTISGNTISFTLAPLIDDKILIDYKY